MDTYTITSREQLLSIAFHYYFLLQYSVHSYLITYYYCIQIPWLCAQISPELRAHSVLRVLRRRVRRHAPVGEADSVARERHGGLPRGRAALLERDDGPGVRTRRRRLADQQTEH